MASHQHQRSTTERQLGYEHQQLRKRLLPQAWGKPCPYCRQEMLPGQDLDLDHATPRVFGGRAGEGRMAHRHCNRSAGARLGAALRRGKRPRPAQTHARKW